ncbi:MAG: class I SAM-dependent methyltransferase [Chloroflexi bacterium]|nr:class I SAM-dependent methyltransferase [Chloroflexota bacterium]
MFENFPKARPDLPDNYRKIYEYHYKLNRQGGSVATSLSKRSEGWMHRKIAEDVSGSGQSLLTLEIGAGTMNHLPYEPASRPYDVIEPTQFFYESSPLPAQVRTLYKDIRDIPPGTTYQRLISIATFEHICDLPDMVARCGLLLADGGQLRVGIPSEGTLLWRMGWRFTTGLEFRLKYGLDYSVLLRHEHVNTAADIEEVLRYFFGSVSGSVFGVNRALSFYQFFACSAPVLDRCHAHLRA